jgi:multiple sugar transport system permease protein
MADLLLSKKKSGQNERFMPAFFVMPAVMVLVLLVLYPFFYGIYVSFFETNLIARWDFVGLGNYFTALKDSTFWSSLWTTIVFTVSVVSGHFLFGLLLANILNKEIRFRAFFRAALLLPWLFPEVVIANLWKFMFHPTNGLINSFLLNIGLVTVPVSFLGTVEFAMLSLVVVCIWKGTPLIMIQILAALQTVPGSIKEAAIIDGASKNQVFFSIILPSLKTTMMVTLIMDTIWWFKHVTMIWLITQGGPGIATNTLSIDIYKRAFEYFDFGLSSAIAVLVFFICAFITVGYKRLLRDE